MRSPNAKPDERPGLRAEAEAKLKKQVAKLQKASGGDTDKLIHELRVHQIELEMQNEQLRRAQQELEQSRARYCDLYDLAPVGYFTFDKNGLIIEANLTGCQMLGIERSFLIKKPFSAFVDKSSQNPFHRHRQAAMTPGLKQTCEITLVRKDGEKFEAQLESVAAADAKGDFTLSRTTISDTSQRKQIEDELRKLASIVEHTSEFISLASLDEKIIFMNDAGAAMLGIPSEKIGQTRILDVVGDNLKDKVKSEVLPTLKKTGRWEGELQYRNLKTGKITDVYATTFTVNDPKTGKPLYLANTSIDITERKRAEQQILQNVDTLTRMHALSTRILGAEGLELMMQDIMDTAVAIMRADKGTLQLLEGEVLRIVAHHGHSNFFLDFFANVESRASVCGEAMKRSERVVVEDVESSSLFAGTESLTVLRNAGVRAAQSTPLLCRKGKLLGVLTTQWSIPHIPDEHDLWRLDLLARQVSDIIEQRRAEAALRESEENARKQAAQLSATLNAAPAMIWTALDRDCRVITGNRTAYEFSRVQEGLGLSKSGPTPEKLSHYRIFKDGKELSAEGMPVQHVARSGKELRDYTIDFVFDDGTVRSVLGNVNPILDSKGNPAGAVAVFVDVTERQKYEEQLRQINQELERSNADLHQFAYVASHDLREPLRAITGFMDLLRRRCKDTLDAKANEYINYAASGAKRMDDLLTGLLEYSRVQTQGKPRAAVPAQAALNTAVENLRADIDESNAVISSDSLPSVNVDGMQFTQLLQNLLHNAIKFRSDQRPEIHVGCTRQDDGWLFCVRDNSIGIGPQFHERVFTIFHRVNPQDKRSGYGVGLSICKRIVERHNGKIWVESKPGSGSAFYFTIPDKGGLTG